MPKHQTYRLHDDLNPETATTSAVSNRPSQRRRNQRQASLRFGIQVSTDSEHSAFPQRLCISQSLLNSEIPKHRGVSIGKENGVGSVNQDGMKWKNIDWSSPIFMDTLSRLFSGHLFFVIHRRQIPQARMKTLSIVEDFDIVEDIPSRLVTGAIPAVMYQLFL